MRMRMRRLKKWSGMEEEPMAKPLMFGTDFERISVREAKSPVPLSFFCVCVWMVYRDVQRSAWNVAQDIDVRSGICASECTTMN